MVRVSLAAAAALPLWFTVPARAAEPVDLALVLAVDSSSSVNYDEFHLQMDGFAEAFRDGAVLNAIKAAARTLSCSLPTTTRTSAARFARN